MKKMSSVSFPDGSTYEIVDATARNDISLETANRKAEIAEERKRTDNRISNIIVNNNPTEGNTELIDIRTGVDGTVYASAGDAVRSQILDLQGDEIRHTASGKQIVLTDASNKKVRGLKIYGETTQKTTTGKQLLPYPYAETTKTIDGVTYTDLGDGGIKVSGTQNGNQIGFFLYGKNDLSSPISDFLVAGKSYTISGSNDFVDVTIMLLKEDGSGYNYSGTFTVPNDAKYCAVILDAKDGVTCNTTIYPMLREANTTDTYEPYTGGIPSPNPDYPQELKSVGDSGSYSVEVYGKNILPYPFPNSSGTSYTSDGLTFTVDEDGIITINGKSTSQTTYYIARWLGSAKYDRYICVMSTDDIDITVYKAKNWFRVGNNKYLTVSAGEDLSEIYLQIDSGKTFNNAKVKVMITLEPNYDYEPYTKQSLTTPYTLRSDKSGVTDEVDFNRGVHTQNVQKFVANGSEDWWYDTGNTRFALNFQRGAKSGTIKCWSSHYVQGDTLTIPNSFNMSSNVIYINDDRFTNATDFKNWLSSNNVTFYYPLATPIEKPLTETELNAYHQLHTNKSNTTILSEADLDLVYVEDIQHYIDKKFAELSALILEA